MTNSGPSYAPYKKIGLFDSGVGGLSVLRQLAASLPGVNFVYLGDTARLPYGNRSRSEIATFVREIVGFLTDFGLDAVVMACNTSAALAQDVAIKCASKGGFEVFNLIEPLAAHLGPQNLAQVGVLATRSTANSGAFARALRAVNFAGKIVELGCPKLVPLIESGRLGEPQVEDELSCALEEYLLAMAGAQAIVLGCTHFAFIADRIEALVKGPLQASFPGAVPVLDPAVILCRQMLGHFDLNLAPDAVKCKGGFDLTGDNIEIFTTGSALGFSQTARVCLGRDLGAVKELSVSLLTEADGRRSGVSGSDLTSPVPFAPMAPTASLV